MLQMLLRQTWKLGSDGLVALSAAQAVFSWGITAALVSPAASSPAGPLAVQAFQASLAAASAKSALLMKLANLAEVAK